MTRAALALLALALAGCAPREQAGPPAPSSSLTYAEAQNLARLASLGLGGATVGGFAGSGSMLPHLDSRSVAVWEPVTPATRLHPGDIVSFEHAGRAVAHAVVLVEGDRVRTRGLNNPASDSGWQRPTRRLVALVYASR